MKLSEILSVIDGVAFTKWLPSSTNGDSRVIELGRLPLDGWEEAEKKELANYPSGTLYWQYYRHPNGKVIRQQKGSGYIFGQITEVVK